MKTVIFLILTALYKIRVCLWPFHDMKSKPSSVVRVASHDTAANAARGKWSSQRRIGIAYSSASPSVVLAATSESIPSTVLDTNEATARPPAIKHPRPGSHSVGPLSCHAHRPHSIAAVPAYLRVGPSCSCSHGCSRRRSRRKIGRPRLLPCATVTGPNLLVHNLDLDSEREALGLYLCFPVTVGNGCGVVSSISIFPQAKSKLSINSGAADSKALSGVMLGTYRHHLCVIPSTALCNCDGLNGRPHDLPACSNRNTTMSSFLLQC